MRLEWEAHFMAVAKLVSEQSTCLRRKVGAVSVKNRHILTTGFNGAPTGSTHCKDIGCLRQQLGIPSGENHELCRAVHAEQNVIINAAYDGVAIAGADLYCTHMPCSICAKMIVNVGIVRVIYLEGYPDEATLEILGPRLVKAV